MTARQLDIGTVACDYSRAPVRMRLLLQRAATHHTGEASYNDYYHLIRDACGADFDMRLRFVSWLT